MGAKKLTARRVLPPHRNTRKGVSKSKHVQEELPSDDEIDKFHKTKDKLSLNPAEDDASSGENDSELNDEAVYNLSASEGSSDEDEDDEDDFEDDEEDEGDKSRYAQLKREEKRLRAKLQLRQGEDDPGDDDEEEDTEEDEEGAGWGTKKRVYYDADGSDDEEAAKEEQAEALRLQRKEAEALLPEDFEQPSEPESEEDAEGAEEEAGTLGAAAARAARGEMEIEEVQKDLGAMTTEEQRAAVMRDAPELAALLADLQSSLAEVRSRVGPLLKEVREGQLATAEGVSYLEAKYLLLLHYCIHLVFYVLLKAEGRPVRDHPVIARLVEIRAFLEKARPIDKRLRYQMDKLLAAAALVQAPGAAAEANGNAGEDFTQLGPRPENLMPRMGDKAAATADGAADGIYRPPKLNPAAMQEDPDKDYGKKDRRREDERKRKAARSGFVRDLVQEIEGAPEEVQDFLRLAPPPKQLRDRIGEEETIGLQKARAKLAARAAQEEELMARVPLSKAERKNLKAQRRAGLSGGIMLDDFADDVADLIQAGEEGDIDPAFLSSRKSQKYGADLTAAAAANVRSGDADLPTKAPLHERRAKFDQIQAKRAANEAPEEVGGGGKRQKAEVDFEGMGDDEEEDPFYEQAAGAAQRKKSARKDKYSAAPSFPPVPDQTVEGARPVSRAVEKNRGLTPHRRKDIKNPRVKNKMRFEKKSKARRGQVQEAREPSGAYGGEASGIKGNVSKSRRF